MKLHFRKSFLFLLFPLLVFLPQLSGFPYPTSDTLFSDFTISHFSNYHFLQQALLNEHVVPLWSPQILSGTPFIANPLSGLWYPPGWLVLLFPLPLGMNLVATLHLVLAGVGMYLFARHQHIDHGSALAGALVFQAFSKIYAHYGAGHFGLVLAVCWTPWLLLVGEQRSKRVFLTGILLALIFLCDPRWAAYSGLLWVFWEMVSPSRKKTARKFTSDVMQSIWFITRSVLAAAALTAPVLLPFIQYASLSTRSTLSAADVLTLSLPSTHLLGGLYPWLGGSSEWVWFPGSFVCILVVFSVIRFYKDKFILFWLFVAISAVAFSLGDLWPWANWFASLPGLSLLRVPPRSLFLVGFSLALVSAYVLNKLANGVTPLLRQRQKYALFSFVFSYLLVTLGLSFYLPDIRYKLLIHSGFILINACLVWMLMIRFNPPVFLDIRGDTQPGVTLILIVICLEGWFVAGHLIVFKPSSLVLKEKGQIVEYLASQPGLFRVYSPSYSVPAQIAAINGLQTADGVDPIQLRTYVDYMSLATGVPGSVYSVTVPPLNGLPSKANQQFVPDPGLLGLLNVKYVIAEFQLNVSDLKEQTSFGSTRIYENMLFRPRAWASSDPQPQIVRYQPNQIDIMVQGPSSLVISEIAYPGRKAYLDGEPIAIDLYEGLFVKVKIPEGIHLLSLRFQPYLFYWGLLPLILILIIYPLHWIWHGKIHFIREN